jgi:hypothetical protein
MSGSRTRLEAAAEAGFSEGPPFCDEIEKGKIVSARDRGSSGDVFVRFRSCCGIII